MDMLILLVAGIGVLVLGYWLYGRFLAREIFQVSPSRPVPAVQKYDGRDFVPARKWWILFGHHFASIAGAGPIVGPIFALMVWGPLPALVWILLGVIWIGGMHDLGALMVSLRSGGKTIADATGELLGKTARIAFLLFVLFALLLVVAVFLDLASESYQKAPQIVIPSLGMIPVAMGMGWLIYRMHFSLGRILLAGVGLVIAGIFLGERLPVEASREVWMAILLAYIFLASVLPVQYLLQPRDVLMSVFLIVGLLLMVVAVISGGIRHPEALSFPDTPWLLAGDQPLYPFLFVTIACGAISGFHSMVASGTTARQLPSERYALRIAYGSMLLEGFLALLVILLTGAFLFLADKNDVASGVNNPILVFGESIAFNLGMAPEWVRYFAIFLINGFILTTLDSSARIARYVMAELTGVQNPWVGALLITILAGALLWAGHASQLWQVFGGANQLMGALALTATGFWILRQFPHRRWFSLTAFLPALWMYAVTIPALLWKVGELQKNGNIPGMLFAGLLVILAGGMLGVSLFRIGRQIRKKTEVSFPPKTVHK